MKKLLLTLAVTFAVAAPVAYDMVDALQFHNALEATHQAERGTGDNKYFGPGFWANCQTDPKG